MKCEVIPSMSVELQFLGAAGTVTGSKYLLSANGQKILIDCGLFQGDKELQSRNWKPFPVPPSEIDVVLATHAHLDHVGYLPKLAGLGYRGKIYCTPATSDLLEILLLDAAHLEEEEAAYHNRRNGCCPAALPLYTVADAEAALILRAPVPAGRPLQPGNVSVDFLRAAHILGSAFIRVKIKEDNRETILLFSGDIGRFNSLILGDPQLVPQADFLLLESTYGGRSHGGNPKDELLAAVRECLRRKGCLLVPAFAVGRTQDILFTLRELLNDKAIPPLPVYVDSPMAADVTHVYQAHHEEHDLEMEGMEKGGRSPFGFPNLHYVRTVEESKALNAAAGPLVVIAANGMLSGGRVMHHLAARLGREDTVLLFVGYQAQGTRGRRILEGAKTIRIFHQDIPVKAAVFRADSFSAHADGGDILRWLGGFTKSPSTVFLVHGENDARQALSRDIREKFPGWKVELPEEMEIRELS